MKSIIAQGAEAIIIQDKKDVIKERVRKSYRLLELDNQLRKQRTKSEVKLLQKASLVIPVPLVSSSQEYNIQMQYIQGKRLSEHLDKLKNASSVCKQIGKNIAKMHDADIIHGDLTTSNIILASVDKKVYFIDFGLGFVSAKSEDKAVDLHLIKEALNARHFNNASRFWSAIMKGYLHSKKAKEVLKRLKIVEQRGRYKAQY